MGKQYALLTYNMSAVRVAFLSTYGRQTVWASLINNVRAYVRQPKHPKFILHSSEGTHSLLRDAKPSKTLDGRVSRLLKSSCLFTPIHGCDRYCERERDGGTARRIHLIIGVAHLGSIWYVRVALFECITLVQYDGVYS